MAYIKSLFRSDDAQLMIIVDTDTGAPLKNDKGDEMGIFLNSLKCEDCKKVISQFQRQHKKRDASMAERERFGIELLVAATDDFHNIQLEEKGKVIEYSDELARDIYEKSDIIRRQVDEYLGKDEHFLTSALKS